MRQPVVMPTDFSARSAGALEWARKMADALDAPLHCVYVAPEPRLYSSLDLVSNLAVSKEEMKQLADKEMQQFATNYRLGSTVKTVVLQGTPFVEIIRYARDQNAAVIVISTHGYSGLKHMLLGSTTESVVRKATCPVLSVPSPDVWFELP